MSINLYDKVVYSVFYVRSLLLALVVLRGLIIGIIARLVIVVIAVDGNYCLLVNIPTSGGSHRLAHWDVKARRFGAVSTSCRLHVSKVSTYGLSVTKAESGELVYRVETSTANVAPSIFVDGRAATVALSDLVAHNSVW